MMKHTLLAVLALAAIAGPASAEDERIARGAYLARIMDCAGCHMPRDRTGAPINHAGLSGGSIGFEIPGLGTFWPPNLTPAENALGSWSEDEIVAAIRTGLRPDGRLLAPAMPWPSYAALSDEDAHALAAYMSQLEPVDGAVVPPLAPDGTAAAPFYRVVVPGS